MRANNRIITRVLPHIIRLLVGLSLLAGPLAQPAPAAAQAEIGPEAVWQPTQQGFDDLIACMSTDNWEACMQTVILSDSASEAAVRFVQLVNGRGYLASFEEYGRVDAGVMVAPFAANDNAQWLMLNGSPQILEARSARSLDLSQRADFARLQAIFPQVIPWEGMSRLESSTSLETGGQRFIFTFPLLNGCHACEQVGLVRVAFDFSLDGIFQGDSVLGIESVHLKPQSPPGELPGGLIAYIDQNIASANDNSLLTVHPDGNNQTRWVSSESVSFADISPDGRYLAYMRDEYEAPYHRELWVIDLASGDRRMLLENVLSYLWFPDSRSLVFTPRLPDGMDMCMLSPSSAIRGLDVYDIASGQVTPLVPAINQFPLFPTRWSPDGSILAFSEQHYCEGAGLFGYYLPGENRAIVEPERLGGLDFSPDGRSLVYDGIIYAGQADAIYLRDLESGQVSAFQARKKRDYCCPRFSPDGSLVAFLSGEKPVDDFSPQTLWVAPAGGGDARQVVNFPVSTYLWSPDGRYFAVNDHDLNLLVVSVDGSYQQVIGRGWLTSWQTSASPPEIIPAPPGGSPQTPGALISTKQSLINTLENLQFDISDLNNGPDLPAAGLSYDESKAQALLDALKTSSDAGQLTPEQHAVLERLVLFEDGFYQLYKLEARAVNNTTRGVIGVVSLSYAMVQVLHQLRSLLQGEPIAGEALDKLLRKGEQKAIEVMNDFFQMLASEINDEDIREGLKFSIDIINEYMLVELEQGANVIDMFLQGIGVAFGHYALIGGAYIPGTQPALDIAAAEAQMPQAPAGSLEVARNESAAVLSIAADQTNYADQLYHEMEDAADLPKVIAGIADIGAIVTSTSLLGPIIAESIATIARAIATAEYAAGTLVNVDVLLALPQSTYDLEDACFDPQGSALRYPWKVVLKQVGPARSVPAGSQSSAELSRLQQAYNAYQDTLAQLLEAARSADTTSIVQRLEPFLQAEDLLDSLLRTGSTRLYASPATTREMKTGLYAVQAQAHLQSTALYVVFASLLSDPNNPDLQQPVAAAGAAAYSSMAAYQNIVTAGIAGLSDSPSRLVISSISYPDEVVPGELFKLQVILTNAGSQSLSGAEVAVFDVQSDQPAALTEVPDLNSGHEHQAQFTLRASLQGNQMLRIEARRGGTLDDLRYVLLTVSGSSSESQTPAAGAPVAARLPYWVLPLVCACALFMASMGLFIGIIVWYRRYAR